MAAGGQRERPCRRNAGAARPGPLGFLAPCWPDVFLTHRQLTLHAKTRILHLDMSLQKTPAGWLPSPPVRYFP